MKHVGYKNKVEVALFQTFCQHKHSNTFNATNPSNCITVYECSLQSVLPLK